VAEKLFLPAADFLDELSENFSPQLAQLALATLLLKNPI
jgi:hypothetical protein